MSIEAGKKTLEAYVIGFSLSVILTLMAFGVVIFKLLDTEYTYISLAALAITQLIVQSICFLSLNKSKAGQWNLLPFLFTILIIAILASGSFWIMYNLNFNMFN